MEIKLFDSCLTLTVVSVFPRALSSAQLLSAENGIRFVLNSAFGGVQVERAVLNVGEDAFCGLEKRLFDSFARFGGSFQKSQTVFVRELFGLVVSDVSLRL